MGKIPIAEKSRPPPSGGNPICEAYGWMYVYFASEWVLFIYGVMDGCILEGSHRCLRVGAFYLRGKWMVVCWKELVDTSEWVLSIYVASG